MLPFFAIIVRNTRFFCRRYNGGGNDSALNYRQDKTQQSKETEMTVRQRVLEARLLEKARKNPKLAKEMGIKIECPVNLDNKIENEESQLVHEQ